MNQMIHAAKAALLALPVTFGMLGAVQAQSSSHDMQRVEVSGKPSEMVRRDVIRSCPGIAATLQKALEQSWHLEEKEATVRVTFRLDGEETSDVRSHGGPLNYRMAVRRAVSGMQCTKQATDGQLYSFAVSFVAPLEGNESYRVALMEN